jgi:hypothetical protein
MSKHVLLSFAILDVDGHGKIDKNEFIEGTGNYFNVDFMSPGNWTCPTHLLIQITTTALTLMNSSGFLGFDEGGGARDGVRGGGMGGAGGEG